jgi:hypothetical protein
MIERIDPVWHAEDFYQLDYVITTHKDPDLVRRYVDSGHLEQQITIGNYHEPRPMPQGVQDVKDLWSQHLDSVAVAVNLFRPGWYLPLHQDLYGAYNRCFNAEDRPVMRAVVMLEHSEPGQIMQIGDQIWGDWSAGSVFQWHDREPHAFYNFSLRPRYALQVTGLVR